MRTEGDMIQVRESSKADRRTTVLIAAGGTGGHLFPGLAVADEVLRRRPDARVVFVGTARGIETRLVPRAGYALRLLPILPLNSVGWLRLLKGLCALPLGLLAAFVTILRLRPAAVLGIGGYAGGPLVLVAALCGFRTVILEPNAQPGFTNRILRPFVGRVACAYEEALRLYGAKALLTGNPVRSQFRNLPQKARGAVLDLLVFGGSQGARVVNQAMLAALARLPGPERLRIVHQTGEKMQGEVAAAYRSAGRSAEVLAFIDDMPARFAQADLIVCRSGATTCAELTVAGKASLLIPFARAANDHQRDNARAMAAAGAARVIDERELSGETLARAIAELTDDTVQLAQMEQAARRLSRPAAAERIADLLLDDDGAGATESERV
jgi:UDP-N-acetylglucosamine--N-acetylmuramyl-(pentapeptide) pyrophosphoryl-undecaprenol N-acetylglucosamine transferase